MRLHQKKVYGLLIKSAARSIFRLAADPRYVGGLVGVMAVLHTWGSNLSYHPHVHCLVTGGGLSSDGQAWMPARDDYVDFDSSDRLVQALRKGYIKGLVLQDPINMGYLGVKTIMAHLRGQKVDKRIDTGSVVATPENMDQPKIKNLLEPDFKKWLNE